MNSHPDFLTKNLTQNVNSYRQHVTLFTIQIVSCSRAHHIQPKSLILKLASMALLTDMILKTNASLLSIHGEL